MKRICQLVAFYISLFAFQFIVACSGVSESWLEKGREALREGKPKEALEALNNAVNSDDKNPRAFNARGVAHFELKDYPNALLDYEQAIRLQPTWYQPYFNRARMKVDQQDWDGALADFSEAISLQPDSSENYTNRGMVLFNLGRTPEALHDLGQAIKLKPRDFTARFNRGNVYFRQQNYKAAVLDFEAAVRADPSFGKAFHALGLARISLGERQVGCLSLKQAVKLGYPDAQATVDAYCK